MMDKRYRLAAFTIACCCAAATARGASNDDPDYKNMYQQLLIEKEALEAKLQMVITQLQEDLVTSRHQLQAAKSESMALRDQMRKEALEQEQRMRGKPENFQIKHAKASDIADVLWETFGNDIKVAIVPSTNSLVIRAADEQRRQIRDLLTTIDTPAVPQEMPRAPESRTLAVNIDLLQATAGSSEAGQLPAHLKSVGEALRASGTGNFKTFGHLLARTHERGGFSANGLVDSGLAAAPTAQVRVDGQVYLSASGNMANLEIKAVLEAPMELPNLTRGGEPKKQQVYRYEDFGIETEASVPLGDYVVLGAIPAKLSTSDTILLVIRVTGE